MVDAVHDVVQVAHQLAVGEVALGVEDEAVQAVLGQREEEEADDCSEDGEGQAECAPRGNTVKHVGDDQQRQQDDGVPFVVGKELYEIGLEHPRRGHEEPVRRVDDLHVALLVEVPYLRQEGLVGLDDPGYLLLEGADDHRVGHDERQRMVKLHLLVDLLNIFVAQKHAPAGMVTREGGHIQDVVVEHQQRLAVLLGVGLNLLVVFKFEVELLT